MTGIIEEIFIAQLAGQELIAQQSAQLVAGKGIVGDRYYLGEGTFSERLKGLPDVEVTLIEKEEVDAFNIVAQRSLEAKDFRRNIVTKGYRLNDLVDRTFLIGNVTLKGIRLCEPCAHLAGILGNDIMDHMIHKAGLRAQIVTSGDIAPGDKISLLEN
ncbi:MAG: MOSC domain-containing protein [Pseudomonadales bacterium]|nr:MOSC domain-containing protein [Pseudomonadales bacterium]